MEEQGEDKEFCCFFVFVVHNYSLSAIAERRGIDNNKIPYVAKRSNTVTVVLVLEYRIYTRIVYYTLRYSSLKKDYVGNNTEFFAFSQG